MILALSRFCLQSAMEADTEHALRDRPWRVEEAKGFLGLEVFRESEDPRRFVLVTRWSDASALRGWHAGADHHGSHAFIPKGLKLDPSGTELVVADRIDGASSGGPDGDLLSDCAPVFALLLREGSAVPVAVLDSGGTVARSNRALDELARREVTGVAFESLLVDTAVATFRAAREADAAGGFVLLHFASPDGPVTVRCLVAPSGAGGHVVVGELAVDDERALARQLQELNSDLARLTRENFRQAAENERVHRELRDAHWHIKKIAEVLPMCLECRKVETGPDAWENVATFLARSTGFLSHGYCATCAARLDAEDTGREPGGA